MQSIWARAPPPDDRASCCRFSVWSVPVCGLCHGHRQPVSRRQRDLRGVPSIQRYPFTAENRGGGLWAFTRRWRRCAQRQSSEIHAWLQNRARTPLSAISSRRRVISCSHPGARQRENLCDPHADKSRDRARNQTHPLIHRAANLRQ